MARFFKRTESQVMGRTHMVAGIASLWVLSPFLGDTLIPLVPVVALGALLPDLDARYSQIRALSLLGITPFVPLAQALHRTFGHRGLLHSLWGWNLVSLLFLPLACTFSATVPAVLSLGYLSHLGLDACTKHGIPLFFPRITRYHLLPRPFRITTGSQAEEVLFILLSLFAAHLVLSELGGTLSQGFPRYVTGSSHPTLWHFPSFTTLKI